MKKMFLLALVVALGVGFLLGRATTRGPQAVLSGQFDDFSLTSSALAQEKKEAMPFGYNSPREPSLASDAPPVTYWNIEDVRKAQTELAEKAAKAQKQVASAG